MQTRPESITAPVATAETLIAYAYHARGEGSADSVSEDGWKSMHQRCLMALAILQKAAQLPTRDPYWYQEMLVLASLEGFSKEKTRELLDEAVAFEPGFYHDYRQYTSYLLPKWYGDDGEAEAFVKEATTRLGGDDGAFLYFELATVVHCQCGEPEDPIEDLSWPKIKEGYAALEKLYGTSRLKKNRFAYMTIMAKDKVAARQIFSAIGEDWEPQVWYSRKRFDAARAWAIQN